MAPLFSLLFCVFHFCPMRNGEQTVTTSRAPYGWKELIWQGTAWYPKGTVCNTAITTSVSYTPWHNTSDLGFHGPEPCLLSKVPTLQQGYQILDFGGEGRPWKPQWKLQLHCPVFEMATSWLMSKWLPLCWLIWCYIVWPLFFFSQTRGSLYCYNTAVLFDYTRCIPKLRFISV